jgi:hypothetical protein
MPERRTSRSFGSCRATHEARKYFTSLSRLPVAPVQALTCRLMRCELWRAFRDLLLGAAVHEPSRLLQRALRKGPQRQVRRMS